MMKYRQGSGLRAEGYLKVEGGEGRCLEKRLREASKASGRNRYGMVVECITACPLHHTSHNFSTFFFLSDSCILKKQVKVGCSLCKP